MLELKLLFEALTPQWDYNRVLKLVPIHLRQNALAVEREAEESEIMAGEVQKKRFALFSLCRWVLTAAKQGAIHLRRGEAATVNQIIERQLYYIPDVHGLHEDMQMEAAAIVKAAGFSIHPNP